MQKILIINHYSTNKGDASTLICMIDALKKYIPNAKFSVSSVNPKVTIGQPEVKALEWIVGGREGKKRTFQKSRLSKILSLSKILLLVLQSLTWVILKRYTGKDVNLLISTKKRELLQEYADADIVISCAGGHLNSSHGLGSYFQFYAILLAIILGKTTMMYAQSVGPFDNKLRTIIYKSMIRLFINKVNLITLRESASKRVLEDLAVVKPPTYVTADSAFLLRSKKSERIKEILHAESINGEENHPLVGITLLHWGYSGSTKREIKHAKYRKAIVQVADYLISQLNAEVVFIPMDIASLPGDDRPLASEIRQMMKYKDNANIITGEYTPEELKGITGQMDLVIGTRLHSLIFAAAADELVPVICIMYDQPKAEGIMKMMGQEKYICDIENIDVDDLATKITEVLSTKDKIKGILSERIDILRKRSLLNAKFAAELLKFATTHKGEKFLLELGQEEIDLLNAI